MMRKIRRPSKLPLGKHTLRTLEAEWLRVAGGRKAYPDETQLSYCELQCMTHEVGECGAHTTVCP